MRKGIVVTAKPGVEGLAALAGEREMTGSARDF